MAEIIGANTLLNEMNFINENAYDYFFAVYVYPCFMSLSHHCDTF
jgi:hypothetical protein